LESADYELFANPEKIVTGGGNIFFALLGEKVAGTVALIREDGGKKYEVSKMAVSPEHRQKGIGEKLLRHLLAYAGENKISYLYLISNTKLTPAIRLYEKLGFTPVRQVGGTPSTHYKRGNYIAELHLPTRPK
jgi:ribosomal protein S18 acetylase RimI-like enzyme